MRQKPNVSKDLKTKFINEEIENAKLNHLLGGNGGSTGDNDGDEGGTGT